MAGVTSNPNVTIQLLPAAIVTAFADRNDLIVGQKLAAGSAVDGALVENLESATTAELIALYGSGELYHRIRQWQLGNDGYSPLSVISVDPEGGATAASATVTITGTATGTGTITVSPVDARQFAVSVDVAVGDTNTDIASAINTALGALTNPPFTAGVVSNVVTITADDVGTAGNYYSIGISGDVAGITYALTTFTGGATDPTLTGIFDVIDGLRYTGINWPEHWVSSVSEVTDLLDARFNPSNDILDGVAFMGYSETYANDLTLVASLNTQSLVVGGNNKVNSATSVIGSAIIQPASWTMSYFQGVRAKRLTPDAPIASDIVALNAPLDAIGGAHTASLPYFNTPLPFAPLTQPTNLFSNTEQNNLADEGFTTFGVNRAKNAMIMGNVVTTRTTDAAGNVNDSFRFLNYIDTGSVCREVFFNTLKAVFAQSRLAEGSARPGYSIANEETIRATLGSIYRALSERVLVESGDTAERYFANNTTVSISKSTRTVTITGPLPIVTQLGVINYPLSLSFSITETGTQITI